MIVLGKLKYLSWPYIVDNPIFSSPYCFYLSWLYMYFHVIQNVYRFHIFCLFWLLINLFPQFRNANLCVCVKMVMPRFCLCHRAVFLFINDDDDDDGKRKQVDESEWIHTCWRGKNWMNFLLWCLFFYTTIHNKHHHLKCNVKISLF